MPAPEGLITRRSLLIGGAGALGLAALGAACSSSDDENSSGPESSQPAGESTLNLLSVFNAQGPYVITGGEQRIAYALADFEGVPIEGPETLQFRLAPDAGGQPIEVEAHRYRDGVPTPYYPLRIELPTAGIWTSTAEVDGQPIEASFSVGEPGSSQLIQRGQPAPSISTPTTADARGVDPICTAEPACDLHALSLDAALAEQRPIALLVATPAFCATAVCGPVLDVVRAVQRDIPDVRYLHTEVYENPLAVDNVAQATPAPITGALGLNYEPSLYLIDASGNVADRLDNVFDITETREAVERL